MANGVFIRGEFAGVRVGDAADGREPLAFANVTVGPLAMLTVLVQGGSALFADLQKLQVGQPCEFSVRPQVSRNSGNLNYWLEGVTAASVELVGRNGSK